MIRAVYKGVSIAASDHTIVVEGNHYFPPESVKMNLLADSPTHTTCPWKGEASYKNVIVDGTTLVDACWYYPEPKAAASNIKGYFAFWKGVSVA